jgi:DNA repair protein RadD
MQPFGDWWNYLRGYQQDAVLSVWEYFSKRTGNPLIAMPTGTGKSLVIVGLTRGFIEAYPTTRIMMLTHVETLISQNHAKLIEFWPTAPVGIYSAGMKRRDTGHQVIFGGIQSMVKNPDQFQAPDIILVDEAHLIGNKEASMYVKFIAAMQAQNPNVKIIGLSATCYRMGMGSLTEGGIFTDVCCDMTTIEWFNWFIEAGFLAALEAKRTHRQIDISAVDIGADGDYVKGQLQEAVNRDEITRDALLETQWWAQQHNRKKWLVFAAGVEHATRIVELLDEIGITSVALHSKQKKEVNAENLTAYKRGAVTVAVSMNMLTTGVDVPDIDLIVMLRPTLSTNLWVQMLGRGTRPWLGKDFTIVLDFTQNTATLGPINDPVLPRPRRKGARRGPQQAAPIRVCGVCASYVHASVRVCPNCGNQFLAPVNISATSSGLAVMKRTADEGPLVKLIDVAHVMYSKLKPRNRPPSLLVTYYAPGMLQKYSEIVCFEHENEYALRMGRDWWEDRYQTEPGEALVFPTTVDQALEAKKTNRLRIPKQIRVWMNKKPKPEVMSHVY